jgi:hypothetical protein
MRLTQYVYIYIIYLVALFAAMFISDALGWTFFELDVAATLILNAIFGIVPFAIGLGCLFLANLFFKPIDMTLPRTHFVVWALLSGFVFGMSYAVSVPLIDGASWVTFTLNGPFVHTVLPPLLVSGIYVVLKQTNAANNLT